MSQSRARAPQYGGATKIAAAVIVALLAAWWVAYELALPLSSDQGIFVWGGHVIRRGGVMYRDAWDVKGPFVFYLAALSEAVFGRNEWGFRAFDVIWQFAALPLVFATSRRLGADRIGAAAASLLYLTWYTTLNYEGTAQGDGWVAILLCLVAFLLLRTRRPSGATLWSCGLILGVCCLFKPTYGMFLFMPVLYIPDLPVTVPAWRTWLARVALIAVGFAIPLALAVLFFLAHGALRDFYESYIGYNLSVYSAKDSFSWPVRLWMMFHMSVLSFRFFIPVLLAVAGLVTVARRIPRDAVMVTAWILATLVNVLIQGKLVYLYQWIPFYPALAVAAGVGISVVIVRYRAMKQRSQRPRLLAWAAGAAAVLAVAIVAGHAALNVGQWTLYALGRSPRADYAFEEYGFFGDHPGSVSDVSRYVAARTSPDDVVLFTNTFALGNFLSDRPSPSRLASNTRTFFDAPGSSYFKRYRTEILRAVAEHPPVYVVAADEQVCRLDPFQRTYCIERFPALYAWLLANYRLESHMGQFNIWRRTS